MDFSTRDTYRHAIEDLSRGSGYPEIEVANRVVQRAKRARVDGAQPYQDRHTEPGYYLISEGRPAFERELGYRVSWKHGLLRVYVRAAVPGYLGTIAIMTGMILALPLLYAAWAAFHLAGDSTRFDLTAPLTWKNFAG